MTGFRRQRRDLAVLDQVATFLPQRLIAEDPRTRAFHESTAKPSREAVNIK